ncbi:MAG TPA: magnesium-translocating P-type ATPase [Acidimicrobiia bacterium]|nr:magnesium-translocating P-type ATPase [Acidimicrobiia bacterium]
MSGDGNTRMVSSAVDTEHDWADLSITEAAALPDAVVLQRMGTPSGGLAADEVARRLSRVGPNVIAVHRVRVWEVLGRQLRSALLLLLVVTAAVSFFVGDRTDAVIIGVILVASVGLGFANEYRAELSAQALHSQIRHRVVVIRDGHAQTVDVANVVPGDRVRLTMGQVVPADVRILVAEELGCDEAVLTGESLPADKSTEPVGAGSALADLASCAFMGTVVSNGDGEAVVVSTGRRTEFGAIAAGLGERQEETEFQAGLRHFSVLLVQVAGVLTSSILVINVLLGRPFLESVLFSLAIAVGITPQLLPAVVTTSLATGSRRLAHHGVLVKRLVCIEDLGDIEILLTDKTGTLTEGQIEFVRAIDSSGAHDDEVFRLGLICNDAVVEDGRAVGGNALDVALWDAPAARETSLEGVVRVASLPFDHNRRMSSVLVDVPGRGRLLVTKGAPESVLGACRETPDPARRVLDAEFDAGGRVVAVATREAPAMDTLTRDDERDLTLVGYLVFLDQPKLDAADALQRLAALGITVKVVTGDNAAVAEKICRDLGLDVEGVLTGEDIAALDDDALRAKAIDATIFARVSPEQKARLIRVHRGADRDVAFLGDGVNDAVALHAADVGISVDSAADVAKDAADIVLLRKDLAVLADGVSEGRRTFANTIKYVLMGTSSNFGNMFSAAVASTFLSFLPMLPGQILLNNLLYDTSQMAIPTDYVDEELVARPSHWDVRFIRSFMLRFGPISSLFDFLTFAIMLGPFAAGPALFRSGWFVESLATQTLVVFVIRTRRIPFWRSRPSRPLLAAVLGVVVVGALLPYSPFAHDLGFTALPADFFAVLAGMVVLYLLLVELAKRRFFQRVPGPTHPTRTQEARHARRVRRRSARWVHHGPHAARPVAASSRAASPVPPGP